MILPCVENEFVRPTVGLPFNRQVSPHRRADFLGLHMVSSQSEDGEMNFTFFPSYEKALKMLPTAEEQMAYVSMLVSYGIHGVDPKPDGSMAWQLFDMNARHVIRAGIKKRKAGQAGGRRGGLATGSSKARYGSQNGNSAIRRG